MDKAKYVIVPQCDLDAIEKARLALYELYPPESVADTIRLHEITEPMWKVANKKYPVDEELTRRGQLILDNQKRLG